MPSTPSILELQAFPVLSASQTTQLLPFGSVKSTYEGEILFEPGDSTDCLVVVLEGNTAVIDRSNGDRVLRINGVGEFNGGLGLLTGQRTFTACVVRQCGTVPSTDKQPLKARVSTMQPPSSRGDDVETGMP
jgi:thioredoxin reductase (NADPH)